MEHTSYNPEHEADLENIDFYKRWVKDTFDYESQKNDVLHDYYQKLQALDPFMGNDSFAAFYNIDVSDFLAARDKLTAEVLGRLEEQLEDTAKDLQQNVFDAKLFEVEVIVDGGVRHTISKVAVFKGRVVPVIENEPYYWPIEGIVFR